MVLRTMVFVLSVILLNLSHFDTFPIIGTTRVNLFSESVIAEMVVADRAIETEDLWYSPSFQV